MIHCSLTLVNRTPGKGHVKSSLTDIVLSKLSFLRWLSTETHLTGQSYISMMNFQKNVSERKGWKDHIFEIWRGWWDHSFYRRRLPSAVKNKLLQPHVSRAQLLKSDISHKTRLWSVKFNIYTLCNKLIALDLKGRIWGIPWMTKSYSIGGHTPSQSISFSLPTEESANWWDTFPSQDSGPD